MSDKAKRIVQRLDAIRGALMTRGGIMVTDAIGFLGEAANLIEELFEELEQVRQERDAAIADMEEMQGCTCQMCAHYYQPDPNVKKWSCRVLGEYWADICDHDGGLLLCGSFKWRGVQGDDRRPD